MSVLSHMGDYFPMTSLGIVSCVVLSLLYRRPGYVLLKVGMTVKCSVSLRGICLESVQEVLLPYTMTFPEFIRLEFFRESCSSRISQHIIGIRTPSAVFLACLSRLYALVFFTTPDGSDNIMEID